MSAKYPWSLEELNLLSELHESKFSLDEIAPHFTKRTKRAVEKKLADLVKSSLENISKPSNGYWSDAEITTLIEGQSSGLTNREIHKTIPTKSFDSISKKLQWLSVCREPVWEDEEIEILKENWESTTDSEIIYKLLPNKTKSQIHSKAVWFGMLRPYAYMRKLKLTAIALKYKNKSHFIREERNAYSSAKKLGIYEEISSHMTTGITFNYPQTFLFELLKLLHPNEKINYNDRKVIKPKEIDVYIPDLKLGFEYDGLRFHTKPEDKELDKIKDEICLEYGIKLNRVYENSKNNQIPFIVEQLENIGYTISDDQIKIANNNTHEKHMSKDDIVEIAKNYEWFYDFRTDNDGLYQFLVRTNSTHIISFLKRKTYIYTEDDYIKAINKCKEKFDLNAMDSNIYRQLIKNKDKFPNAYQLYNSLPDRREISTLSEPEIIHFLEKCKTKFDLTEMSPIAYRQLIKNEEKYPSAFKIYKSLPAKERNSYSETEFLKLINNCKFKFDLKATNQSAYLQIIRYKEKYPIAYQMYSSLPEKSRRNPDQ